MNESVNKMITRRSVRKFKSDMIPKEIIDEIVTAGTYAASGRNMQSPIIIAVTNKELRDKISKVNAEIMGKSGDFDPFYNAPVILIVLADKSVLREKRAKTCLNRSVLRATMRELATAHSAMLTANILQHNHAGRTEFFTLIKE